MVPQQAVTKAMFSIGAGYGHLLLVKQCFVTLILYYTIVWNTIYASLSLL